MQVILPDSSHSVYGNKLVKRLITTLTKKFRLTSGNDIDKAVTMANYMVALDELEEAIKVLESFVFHVEYDDERKDIWDATGQGIILLAYIYRLLGNPEKELALTQIIEDEDYISKRRTRYERCSELLGEYEGSLEYSLSETQKYKCEGLGQIILDFMYYYELLPYFQDEAPLTLEQDLKKIIDECYEKLKEALQ